MSLDRILKAFNARPRKLVQTFVFGDLSAAALTKTIDAATQLPPGAHVLAVNMRALTPFAGPSVTALTCKVGDANDDDAIVSTSNLFAAAVDGQASVVTYGIAPNKRYAAATTLKFLFTAVGANLSALNAGAVTIDVTYHVPDES